MWKDASLSVGFFLALRDIRHSNPWTTALIVCVMGLTFFNMLLLNGILLGLASAAVGSYRQYYSGDVLITPATNKSEINDTNFISAAVRTLPSVQYVSNRSTATALVEYGYQNKVRVTDLGESATGTIVGIDPATEDKVTHLSNTLVAGSFLTPNDADSVVLGSNLLSKYATVRGQTLAVGSHILQSPDVGSRIRLTVNGVQREVTIKGVITTNNTTVDSRIYMVNSALRDLLGTSDVNVNEVAIYLQPNASQTQAKQFLMKTIGADDDIVVQTAAEALPSSVSTIFDTFKKLGDLVGGIALTVGAITIFIVIFVNAVTRRKFIGILKGIGVSARAIEVSYIFQALFYAFAGVSLAAILLMGLLKPYFDLHPIAFAISPASLDISMQDVISRGVILIVTAFISGFIPAWLVTRQNTLDAILGR